MGFRATNTSDFHPLVYHEGIGSDVIGKWQCSNVSACLNTSTVTDQAHPVTGYTLMVASMQKSA